MEISEFYISSVIQTGVINNIRLDCPNFSLKSCQMYVNRGTIKEEINYKTCNPGEVIISTNMDISFDINSRGELIASFPEDYSMKIEDGQLFLEKESE